jgi:cyclopropane-fatty-acyl-phospholipid synthase
MRRVETASLGSLGWEHLQTPVSAPVRARLAQRLFLASVSTLKLQVIMPDGRIFGGGSGRFAAGGDPALRIIDPACFFARLGRHGTLGFGESFLLEAWGPSHGSRMTFEDSEELTAWLSIYARSLRERESAALLFLRRLWHRSLPLSEENSVSGARRNVQAHYDLDADLFKIFLDPWMVYSSAWFDECDDLPSAQLRKLDAILDLAHVDIGTRLLDVGSGFGGLAVRAASERGARVTGITLSQKQHEHATKWAEQLTLGERVAFVVEDYREHSGAYDAIVSVEMIEAVGPAYWRGFFESIDRLLRPGGHFGLQAIVLPHAKMMASKRDFSWVDRYIFPGGALPSLREIDRIIRRRTKLEIIEARRLTDSYARTLSEWRRRFLDSRAELLELGFDERFIRLWVLYFSYFEAAFQSRYCDVWQLGMRKRASAGPPG